MILSARSRLLFVLAAIAVVAQLQAAPPTLTHQGRLLDATGAPVADGFYGATFSLWDDPLAGSMVWSEFQDIQTRSGLFSVELGQVSSFFDIFTEFADQDLYLQTQVQISGGTQELSPRLRLGSVPYSSVAKRVHAIHNGAAFSSSSGVSATDSGAVSALSVDLDGDGVPDRSIDQDCDGISASLHVLKSPPNIGSSGQDGVSLVVDDYSSSSVVAHDLDGDGALDVVVSSVCDATGAKHAINTKGAGGNRVTSVSSSTTESSASSVCSVDLDGDGLLDRRVDEDCDDVSASRSMSFFDIFTETTMDQDCDATGARLAIKTKGTGANRTVACSTSESSASLHLDADDDGDGIPERGIDDDCDGVSASRRVSVSNIGSSGQDGVEVRLRCDPDSAIESTELRRAGAVVSGDYGRHTPFHNSRSMSFFDVFTELSITDSIDATGAVRRLSTHNLGSSGQDGVEIAARPGVGSSIRCDSDSDGDGLAESSVSSSSSSDGADFSLLARMNDGTPARISTNFTVSKQTQGATFGERVHLDGDDDPESEVSHSVSPTTSSMAIKTKGTGADKNRSSVSSSSSPSSSSVVCDQDSDGDGLAESSVSSSSSSTGASQVLHKKGLNAVNVKTAISSSTDDNEALHRLDYDADDDGVAESSITQVCGSGGGGGGGGAQLTVSVDGSHRGHVTVLKAAAVMTDMDSDGNAYFDGQLGIGVAATHRVDVAGGAHCDGTNWVNASDVDSKENFQPVNGQELLDKISDLEITRWNYKGDDETEHIGPTAQDFQKTFGVGSDGKSISTIDPSGIALAAVKELRKENLELKAQVEELKQMVEALAKKK